MPVDSKTLATGIGPEGGYVAPDYAYVQEHEYSYEEVCERIRQALKYGDAGTWDAALWASKAALKFPEADAAPEIAKDTRQSIKWVQRLMDVWKRFEKIRETGKYDYLFFSHFAAVLDIEDDARAQEWLDKASDNSWSAGQLYREITKAGEHTLLRYSIIEKVSGRLEHSLEGFKIFNEKKHKDNFVIIEDKLDKLVGKKVKITISVQQKGDTRDGQVDRPAGTI
ncbi:MAG: hypothetical protein WC614_04515 [bacterium]